MPYERFNQLQDQFFEVSKQMEEAKPRRKMSLPKELQQILKESELS